MPTKKAKLDVAARRAAEIIAGHLETLTPADAKAMRSDLHKLAVKSSRRASHGKASQVRRNAGSRPLSRASSNLHKFPFVTVLKNLSKIAQKRVHFGAG